VKREIAEIQAQEKPAKDNPGVFGQQAYQTGVLK
jgi:hypothetical protein